MGRMVSVAVLVVVLLIAGGLVWAHGPSPTPPAVGPTGGPDQTDWAPTPTMRPERTGGGDPGAVRAMLEACLQAMDDPQMRTHMGEHMSDPKMLRMMEDMMRGMPMMPGQAR